MKIPSNLVPLGFQMDYFVQSRFHSIRSLLSIFAAQPMGPKEALLSAQADQGSDHTEYNKRLLPAMWY